MSQSFIPNYSETSSRDRHSLEEKVQETICERHESQKFAKVHADWDLEHWKHVIWSDESPFTLENSSLQFVWRINDEKTVSRSIQGTIKHQKSINVWGCFSWNGVGDLH